MKWVDPEAVELCRQNMISEKDSDDMSMIFQMFGDSTRLKIMNALLTHEQNFLQKVLIGKLGIAPDETPPFHYG